MWTTKRTKPEPAPTAPVVRDFTYYYAATYYVYRAATVQEALSQVRADLSARAEREAVLVSVK